MITANQAGAVTTIVHDYSNNDNVGLLFLTDIRVMPLIHAPDISGL